MKNIVKQFFIYLASYILPMPVYAVAFFSIVTHGNINNYSENSIYFSFVVGMTLIITTFNYISYKKAFKYLDYKVNKRIFKGLFLFNIILTYILITL